MQLDNRSSSEHKVYVPNKDYVQSHFEFCAKNGWTKSANDGHPSQTGHHQWANELHKFIKQHNLLDRPSSD